MLFCPSRWNFLRSFCAEALGPGLNDSSWKKLKCASVRDDSETASHEPLQTVALSIHYSLPPQYFPSIAGKSEAPWGP